MILRFALFALVLMTSSAQAATITVTTTSDGVGVDGSVSLREALQSLNAGAPVNADVTATGAYGTDDRVVLPASTVPYGVTATELAIAVPLTVAGAGAATTTVSGDGTARLFHVTAGTGTRFEGVTLTGGATTALPGGGAILVDAGSLTLDAAVVRDNSATLTMGASNSGGGGGIYSNGGPVTLIASSVSDNTLTIDPGKGCCHGGGGIYANAGALSVTAGSHVDGNELSITGTPDADDLCCHGGGGLFQDSNGATTIADSTVSANEVTVSAADCCHGGGGVFVLSDLPAPATALTNATIAGNSVAVTGGAATSASDRNCCSGGGGVLGFNGIAMTGSTVTGNTASVTAGDCCHGGGGMTIDVSERPATITGSEISGNSAVLSGSGDAKGGGGLQVFFNAASAVPLATRASMANSLVAANTLNDLSGDPSSGGGNVRLDVDGASGISNSTISGSGSTPPFNPGSLHFGIIDGGTLTLANATVTGRVIADGAEIRARNTLVPDECTNVNGGAFTSLGFNLACVPVLPVGPLADNGGPTRTHALPADHPAIDGGDPSGCTDAAGAALTADQRGEPRAGRCDIGAYEAPAPVATATASAVPTASATASPAPGAAPRCTLTPGSSKVAVRKRRRSKAKLGRLSLTARCDSAASARLEGRMTLRRKKGKARTTRLKAVTVTLAANTAAKLTVQLTKGQQRRLRKARRRSATFTLTAANGGGQGTATANFAKLRPVRAK